jgi:pilus assembly protein CpaE
MEVLIAGRSKDGIDRIKQILNGESLHVAARHINNGHYDPLYGISENPDILVLHLSEAGQEEIASLLERSSEERPATIIIGPADNFDCLRMAMKANVSDYLEEPLDAAELLAAVEKLVDQQTVATNTNPVKRSGQVTALVSSKGGSGASFLAANLAHVMCSAEAYTVALIDLDLQFGSLAQYLDMKTEHGFMPALEMAEHLDETAVNAYMSKHSSGLRLLSPLEDEIILSRDIPLDHFGRLLDLLRHSYDRIVIDLPRQIDELSAEVYERADQILLVTQQEIASVRDAQRLRNLLMNELSIPGERISLVINRYDKNSIVELGDISRSMKIKKEDMIIVPNSYRSVAESINAGIPMFDHSRGSTVTKALMSMNARLQGTEVGAQENVMRRVLSGFMGG